MSSLSIVIPVYNAENTIASLCGQLIAALAENYCLQIVLVNDCSADNSDTVCRELNRSYPGIVEYIELARNFGEHNALMAGLNHATGDLCVTMDDDLQHPPDEVQALITEINKGYDVVYTFYARKNDPFLRNLCSSLHNRIAYVLLNKPADLYLSSFKIMRRFLVQEIIKYTGPDPYIDAIILRTTRSIGKVCVRHDLRKTGRSGYTFGKLLSLWGNTVVSFSLYPLRVLGIIGTIMTFIGVLHGGYTFLAWALPSIEDPDSFEIMSAIFTFFLGFLMLAISLVGEYVGRIYLTLNREPQFVIRDKIKRSLADDMEGFHAPEVL
jgi:glycosyltransferase involved in cell wall biosynthesis